MFFSVTFDRVDPSFGCSVTLHCGNTGVEWIPTKSQHRRLTLEKNIFQPFLSGFELATFRSRVRHSTNLAIPTNVVYSKDTMQNNNTQPLS